MIDGAISVEQVYLDRPCANYYDKSSISFDAGIYANLSLFSEPREVVAHVVCRASLNDGAIIPFYLTIRRVRRRTAARHCCLEPSAHRQLQRPSICYSYYPEASCVTMLGQGSGFCTSD
jgi:hypothetical protein